MVSIDSLATVVHLQAPLGFFVVVPGDPVMVFSVIRLRAYLSLPFGAPHPFNMKFLPRAPSTIPLE